MLNWRLFNKQGSLATFWFVVSFLNAPVRINQQRKKAFIILDYCLISRCKLKINQPKGKTWSILIYCSISKCCSEEKSTEEEAFYHSRLLFYSKMLNWRLITKQGSLATFRFVVSFLNAAVRINQQKKKPFVILDYCLISRC